MVGSDSQGVALGYRISAPLGADDPGGYQALSTTLDFLFRQPIVIRGSVMVDVLGEGCAEFQDGEDTGIVEKAPCKKPGIPVLCRCSH